MESRLEIVKFFINVSEKVAAFLSRVWSDQFHEVMNETMNVWGVGLLNPRTATWWSIVLPLFYCSLSNPALRMKGRIFDIGMSKLVP
jgi:hypothetical protein